MLPTWTPGVPVAGPAYLDANVLVAALIRSEPLYPSAAQLMGRLLADGTPIVLSETVVNESVWALAKISYCDLMNQRYGQRFSKTIYRRHYGQIFSQQGAKVNALRLWLHALIKAGHPIDLVNSTRMQWPAIVDNTTSTCRHTA